MPENIENRGCKELRERLARLFAANEEIAHDQELATHFATCEACASYSRLLRGVTRSAEFEVDDAPIAPQLSLSALHDPRAIARRRTKRYRAGFTALMRRPIAVYQALAVAFLVLVFWGSWHFTTRPTEPRPMVLDVAPVELAVLDSVDKVQRFQLIGVQNLGATIGEDTLFIRFVVSPADGF